MALLYRRNGASRVSSTIPPHHTPEDEINRVVVHDDDEDDDEEEEDDDDDEIARRLTRRYLSTAPNHIATGVPLSLWHRICQTFWLGLLVYAFLGLPVLGRILNFCRYFHRFTVISIFVGLSAGALQDIAIFMQAATLIVLAKALFRPYTLRRRYSAPVVAPPALSSVSGSTGSSNAASALAQERYPHSLAQLPVYFPVRTHDFDIHVPLSESELDVGGGGAWKTSHLTLVTSSSAALPTLPWSVHPAGPSKMVCRRLKNALLVVLLVVSLTLVLMLSTITSVADFCLQLTMHPRLNRAFVEIFVNYFGQFTASLMDEEVLTPAVLLSLSNYLVVLGLLTYGFAKDRLPLLPDFLRWSLPSASAHTGRARGCCFSLASSSRRTTYRKNSTTSAPAPPNAPTSFVKRLYRSYWARSKAAATGADCAPGTAPGAASSLPRALPTRLGRHNGNDGMKASWISSLPLVGGSVAWLQPQSLLGIVLHCAFMTLFATLGALCVSLIVHSSGNISPTKAGRHPVVAVDMQLMANPMFSLQTEPFFARHSRIGSDHINCTQASSDLLKPLSKFELFNTSGLGNDDSCALLWRKTTQFNGDKLWSIDWKQRQGELENANASTPAANATGSENMPATAASTKRPPNIILINMESWRALDVGVLGGAAKKKRYGKSVTPRFDELTRDGILYSKHYSPCVQTTRTLLTTLFGMLPSCTETTALKMYGPTMPVQGLPQFLKQHGYVNMFWSAVDLTWEYWDAFLLRNGFDRLVDDRFIRRMLHDVRDYQDRDDDHFSWGMHDDLSFEMLLYALEAAKNSSMQASVSNATTDASTTSDRNIQTPTTLAASNISSETKSESTPTVSDLHMEDATHPDAVHQDDATAKTVPLSMQWDDLREPFFLDVYSITSHNPWAIPSYYQVPDLSELYTRFNKRYLDSVYFSDDMLGQFIDALREKGLMNNTIVMIQGDHGYGRLEHENNPSVADSAVYEEVTHVPFLLLADDFLALEQRGKVIDQLTMQSDIMATVADIVGVSDEDPLLQHGFGKSMSRRHRDQATSNAKPNREHDQDESGRRIVLCNPFNGMTKGVRTEDFKYTFQADGSFKVFDIEADPMEKAPVHSGYDLEQMDATTLSMYEFVTRQVDWNQFLYEASKFQTAPAQSAAANATASIAISPTRQARAARSLDSSIHMRSDEESQQQDTRPGV